MQLQQMDDSLKALVAAFKKDSHGLARGKAIGNREEEYQQRAQDLNQRMQQRQADLTGPLMEQVSKVLDEFRVQGNYAMIFDVGTPSRIVVSADSSLDITDQVIARLKQLGLLAANLPHRPL